MRSAAVPIALLLAGCATGTTPEATAPSVPAEPRETPSAPGDAGAPTPGQPTDRACDTQHRWDERAGACRLYPGGGNGWAGCSMQPGPPSGEACFTGTHWEQRGCDCVCDGAGQAWDPEALRCR